jgi:hypothetical protein
MRPSILLRVASIITLLYFAAHTAGMPWTPAVGLQEAALLESMKSLRFDAMGYSRTYWDFYIGFGLAISGFLLVQVVVLWQLASRAKADPVGVRPIIASFFVSFLVNAILVWRFFFTAPLVLAIAIAICLGTAFASARSRALG